MSHATTLQTASPHRSIGLLRNGGLWLLQIAAAAMFVMAGWSKLVGAPEMIGLFDAVGIGQWFRYLTGLMEVGGAILLLVPALAGVGALIVGSVMVGAITTHLLVVGGSAAMPMVLLVAAVMIAYGRRERTLRLIGR
jgi:putative oxidoreductase